MIIVSHKHDPNFNSKLNGKEKKKLTVEKLLHQFEVVSGEEFASDKAILG
jgi:putative ABC transport system ATP-binding protein